MRSNLFLITGACLFLSQASLASVTCIGTLNSAGVRVLLNERESQKIEIAIAGQDYYSSELASSSDLIGRVHQGLALAEFGSSNLTFEFQRITSSSGKLKLVAPNQAEKIILLNCISLK